MENKYKVIAIVGKSGAGKDAILNALCDKYKGLNKIISTTTRPIREGEVEGVSYHYVTGDEFGEKVVNFEMIEACDFRDWFYGTELKALDPKR
ncbi:MAG: GTPase, partial [Anaerovoracaceae bacterium]